MQKNENDYYWDEIKELNKYYNSNQLYIGHISIKYEDKEQYDNCYIMDSGLHTKRLEDGTILINADDRDYAHIVNGWKFPKNNKHIDYSRNIDIKNKKLVNVDIIYDSMSDIYSSIQDQYLLKTLVNNKFKPGIKSIIRTIQEKQDIIVTLPEKDSFALQGCAGSGKTMVLLHRLRYLIYNNEIDYNYLLLVPSAQFKDFIKDAAKDFQISNSNISTYKEYFVKQCGKTMDDKMIAEDEINFSDNFLARVYDKKLIKECYVRLIKQIYAIGNKLIEFCEEKLNLLVEKEKANILIKRPVIQAKFIDVVQQKVNLIQPLLDDTKVTLQNVNNIILTITQIRDIEKDKYNTLAQQINNYKVTEEELLKDNELFELNELIIEESKLVKKASIFTRESHKRKLKLLNNSYTERVLEVREKIEKEAKERERKLLEQSTLAGNITINQLDEIANYLINIQERYNQKIQTLPKDNIEGYLIEKYQNIGDDLNEFITLPEKIEDKIKKSIIELQAIPNEIINYIELGKKLLNELDNENINKITGEVTYNSNITKLFNIKTKNKLERALQQVLMHSAKKIIKDEFNIQISNA